MLKVVVLLFCVVVKETYAAQAILPPVPKPPEFAAQEGCYDPELNKVLRYSESFSTPNCTQHQCEKNGDIVITSCGALGVLEGQVLVKGNHSLPYPQCCDHVEDKPKKS